MKQIRRRARKPGFWLTLGFALIAVPLVTGQGCPGPTPPIDSDGDGFSDEVETSGTF